MSITIRLIGATNLHTFKLGTKFWNNDVILGDFYYLLCSCSLAHLPPTLRMRNMGEKSMHNPHSMKKALLS